MYLLRIIALVLVTGMTYLSCKPEGALTPEDAFRSLMNAYTSSDAGTVSRILSKDSRRKIKEIIKIFSRMDEKQIVSLSERFGVSVQKMKSLTVEDYLSLQIALGKQIGGDVIREIARCNILGTDVKGDRASVRVDNGMELCFIKEGPYWKFDMTEL